MISSGRSPPPLVVRLLITSSRLAGEYQLVLKYRKEFHDMFMEFSEHSEFGPLMNRMQVIDTHGASKMDEEQWEAASESNLIYRTYKADIAPRHLHWVYLRETIVVSLLYLCVRSLRFALLFLFLLSPLHSLLYIFIATGTIRHQPLVACSDVLHLCACRT